MLRIGPQSTDVTERTRKEEFDGVKFVFKAKDPYGHWSITCLKTNKTLPSVYTSITEAKKAAEQYAADIKKVKA